MTKTALVLAGHGSHITPATAGLVWAYVDALRAANVADEITAAFWKEQPSFHTVFNTLTADDITIVPLFTAQGYFTQTVIPAEMGLEGAINIRDGRTIRYTRTLSEHPYLAQVVRERVQTALADLNATPHQTAVALIGHSTRRSAESRKAAEAQAQTLRAGGLVAQVEAVYLDDSPEIAEIYTLTSAPTVIAVPYFLALGSHTTLDVPRELGLAEGQTRGLINGRMVYYTPPVGTDEALRTVILELAREAGAPLYDPAAGSAWDCFPAAGRDHLLAYLRENGTVQFGELWLNFGAGAIWQVAPTEQPAIGDQQTFSAPADLRAFLRENPFHPLMSAVGLKTGWRVAVESPEKLHAVIETIYPGAVADWAAGCAGTLNINSLDTLATRQTGMYRAVDQLSPDERAALIKQVCGGCVRQPTWFEPHPPEPTVRAPSPFHREGEKDSRDVSSRPYKDQTSGGKKESIPCPEPCNFWLSRALGQVE